MHINNFIFLAKHQNSDKNRLDFAMVFNLNGFFKILLISWLKLNFLNYTAISKRNPWKFTHRRSRSCKSAKKYMKWQIKFTTCINSNEFIMLASPSQLKYNKDNVHFFIRICRITNQSKFNRFNEYIQQPRRWVTLIFFTKWLLLVILELESPISLLVSHWISSLRIISKTIFNSWNRPTIGVEFGAKNVQIDGKTICSVTIKEKSI